VPVFRWVGDDEGRGRIKPSVQDMSDNKPHSKHSSRLASTFGHQTRRWNPKMRRFIFAERNGIHIIDLQKTLRQLELAQKLVRDVVLRGESVLFVCTKAQVAGIVKQEAERAAPCTSPSAGSVVSSPTSRRSRSSSSA
jgi:hypothetical protein